MIFKQELLFKFAAQTHSSTNLFSKDRAEIGLFIVMHEALNDYKHA
jgi:hypothetical protein